MSRAARTSARSVVLSGVAFALVVAPPRRVLRSQPAPTERTHAIPAPAVLAKPKTAFVADLGLLNTSGNSEVTTVSASERVTHTNGFWRFAELVNTVYAHNRGREHTRLRRAAIRAQNAIRRGVSAVADAL